MMIIGIQNDDSVSIWMGVMQLFIPLVGWIWAIVWGVLIIMRAL